MQKKMASRMITAIKIISNVRTQIEKNNGTYSGLFIPNLQSAIDVLSIPDAVLYKQEIPKEFAATELEIEKFIKGM
jgi:hypothetical protein